MCRAWKEQRVFRMGTWVIRKRAENRGLEGCGPAGWVPDRHGLHMCLASPTELSAPGQDCRIEGWAWDDTGAGGPRL